MIENLVQLGVLLELLPPGELRACAFACPPTFLQVTWRASSSVWHRSIKFAWCFTPSPQSLYGGWCVARDTSWVALDLYDKIENYKAKYDFIQPSHRNMELSAIFDVVMEDLPDQKFCELAGVRLL